MQSKAAKIIFIALIVIAGGVFLWFKNYGPDLSGHKAAKEIYKNYVKTEATIISQESNGRIGKGQNMVWTLQFKDGKNELQTVKMDQSSFTSKNNGEKVTIYYDPVNPNVIVSESSYNEVMN